jgi:hypothetical protein
MSVFLKISMGVKRMRATSRATFPCPMTTASSPRLISGARFAYSGRPLYHPTKLLAEYIPLRVSSPFIPRVRSFDAPYENKIAS